MASSSCAFVSDQTRQFEDLMADAAQKAIDDQGFEPQFNAALDEIASAALIELKAHNKTCETCSTAVAFHTLLDQNGLLT